MNLGTADQINTTTTKPSTQIKYPRYVTRYDIASRKDLFYLHLIGPIVNGEDIGNWTLLSEAKDVLEPIAQYLDAEQIAATIGSMMPIEGHKPLKKIDVLVEECARILCMPKPEVLIYNTPFAYAYVRGHREPYQLIISKGLLDLYEGSPDEFRFIIGHELGHIKCGHVRLRLVGLALLKLLGSIDETYLNAVNILPPLGFGRFCSWCRESEISADRAGLICCQNPQVAYNALARVFHGLNAKSEWIDPNNPDFDAERIVNDFREWENRPFVEFLRSIRNKPNTQPFIPERLAALKFWADFGEWKEILSRPESSTSNIQIDIKGILVSELCGPDETVDPYLRIIQRDVVRIQTVKQENVRTAFWIDFNIPLDCEEGEPIYIEILDSTLLGGVVKSDPVLGLFAIHPKRGTTVYKSAIHWDVNERSSITRAGMGSVKLAFLK